MILYCNPESLKAGLIPPITNVLCISRAIADCTHQVEVDEHAITDPLYAEIPRENIGEMYTRFDPDLRAFSLPANILK